MSIEIRPEEIAPMLQRLNAATVKEQQRRTTTSGLSVFGRAARYLAVFIATLVVSAAVMYDWQSSKSPAAPVTKLTSIAEFSVDASIAPETALPEASAITTQENDIFNLQATVGDTAIDIQNRNLSYRKEARMSDGLRYHAVTEAPADAGAKAHAGKLGLRPIPSVEGRYAAQNGVEWQGAWELNNPAGNVNRGTAYMDYLKRNFRHNMKNSLTAKETGASNLSKHLSQPKTRTIPVGRYTN